MIFSNISGCCLTFSLNNDKNTPKTLTEYPINLLYYWRLNSVGSIYFQNCRHFAGNRHALLITVTVEHALFTTEIDKGADGAGVLNTELAIDALIVVSL